MDFKPKIYSFVIPFENLTTESQISVRKWMEKNWTQSIAYSALYVMLIFLGKWFMRDRPRYELRAPLALWSGALAVFSIVGSVRFVPEVIHIVYNYGIKASMIDTSYYNGVAGTWSVLFVWSKAWELGDTAFIILRKQPLIFLHWYHHITVMIYCFMSYAEMSAPGRWFTCMNYGVHALMYSYYTCRAARIRLPRVANILVTSLQIAQMVGGLTVFFYIYWMRYQGDYSAKISEDAITYGFVMYLSYFVLFSNFFYNTYIRKRPAVQPPTVPIPTREKSKREDIFEETLESMERDRPLSKAIAEKGKLVTGFIRTVANINRNGYVKKDL